MSYRNISTPLTSITSIYKFVCIFEKSGPIESTLQDFLCNSIRAKVTSHLSGVTMFQDGMSFLFRNTPPNNFIIAKFENVRFLPQLILNIGKKFLSLCIRKVRRKHITYKVIHKIYIPGYYGSCKKIFIGKDFLDCFFFSFGTAWFNSRKMVCNQVLRSLLVSYFQVKFLEKQHPSDESGFHILLC